jgi:hypothetical protein
MPKYDIFEFIRCCDENKNDVVPLKSALDDANSCFGLKTKSNLLDFIGNNGMEDLKFVNTKEWENNPDKTFKIYVDAYEFRSLCKLGYIAFMYNEKTLKWIIKSFHLSENRNTTVEMALFKAGLIGEN